MTRCFRAVSIGSSVPRRAFEGVVHSVFHRAVNLRVSGERVLLTLLLPDEADLPQGIRLDAPGGSAFEGLPVGARAACKDGVLVVGNSLMVDLRGASIFECDRSSLAVDMASPAVVNAWEHAWHALEETRARLEPVITGTDPAARMPTHQKALVQQLDETIGAVLRATINYDLEGMSVIHALVGAGTGLTPSGDDFLTGYLAGLWCTSWRTPERQAFLRAMAELVVQASARTNDIARTYLLLAARGQVSSRLVDLAEAIGKGAEGDSVASRAHAALQVGHSSGMETVNGLLLGLAAWDRPDLLLRIPACNGMMASYLRDASTSSC